MVLNKADEGGRGSPCGVKQRVLAGEPLGLSLALYLKQ